MNTATFETTTASITSEALEAQVTQLWGTNVIAQKHATEGALKFLVGEDEIEIGRWQMGEFIVTTPGAQPIVVRAGEPACIAVGAFTFMVNVSEREQRIEKNVAAAMLADDGLRSVVGSGMVHAALLAAVAFFMPSMSEANDEVMDRQRMLDLKAYVQSAAEREQEQKPQEQSQEDRSADLSSSKGGAAAKNESGAMGGDKPVEKPGRWSAKGDEKPENAQLARERALKEAAEFGMIGLLASAGGDPNAPIVPWGNVLAGSDRESHMGNLWSGDLGEAFGTGLGLTGTGLGGGGKGEGIGIGEIGGLGHFGGDCDNNGHCGIGHGHGHLQPTHVARGPHLEWNGEVKSNGRLDPAVIQRIVRLNSGRFVGCYKDGLRGNPSLQGRVQVAFVIGRDGSVTTAHDTTGSDIADQNVRACVVKSFYGLSFPEPAGGIVSVTYPFTFTPE